MSSYQILLYLPKKTFDREGTEKLGEGNPLHCNEQYAYSPVRKVAKKG